jgi:O-antigen/teichoic acid export membrane protein
MESESLGAFDDLNAVPPIGAEVDASTIRRGAAAKAAVDGIGLGLATLSAVLTARWLGPAGKGVLAVLIVWGAIFIRVAVVGLGETSVVLARRDVGAQRTAIAANLSFVCISGLVSAVACVGVTSAQLAPSSGAVWIAVAATALGVPIGATSELLGYGLIMRERITQATTVGLTAAVGTTLAVVIFVVVMDLGIAGAGLAPLVGVAMGCVVVMTLLPNDLMVRPRWNSRYLRQALPFGALIDAGSILTVAAARIDIAFVLAIAGDSDAGLYSVAVTIAAVAALAPIGVSYATFPRIASLPPFEAEALAAAAFRRGVLASLIVASGLAATSPLLIPGLFGSAFTGALEPTLILLVGAIFTGGQVILVRVATARGYPRLSVLSFTASVAVMVLLDLALIPPFGTVGAAIASCLGGMAGLLICLRHHRAQGIRLPELLPRPADARALVALASEMLPRTRAAR